MDREEIQQAEKRIDRNLKRIGLASSIVPAVVGGVLAFATAPPYAEVPQENPAAAHYKSVLEARNSLEDFQMPEGIAGQEHIDSVVGNLSYFLEHSPSREVYERIQDSWNTYRESDRARGKHMGAGLVITFGTVMVLTTFATTFYTIGARHRLRRSIIADNQQEVNQNE